MVPPTASPLREHLKALIIKCCDVQNVVPSQVGDDAPLFGQEPLNLTSLDAIEIAVTLEYQFGINLKNASSLREYFKSIAAMEEFILRSADPVKLSAALKQA